MQERGELPLHMLLDSPRLVALRHLDDRDVVGVVPKPVNLCRSHRPQLQAVVRELARE